MFACTSFEKKGKSDNAVIVEKFPIEKEIEGERILLPHFLFKPSGMHIVDSLLIVLQTSGENVFSFFKLPNFEYIKSVGTFGRGPNEFSHVAGGTFYVSRNRLITLIDKQINARVFSVDDLLTDTNLNYCRKIIMPSELFHTFQLVFDGDSLFYGHARNEKSASEVFLFNIYNNKIKQISKYDEEYKNTPNSFKSKLFFPRLGISPNGHKLVLAYYYFKHIKIFNLVSNKSKDIYYTDNPGIENVKVLNRGDEYATDISKSVAFFEGDIRTTDKYIYLEIFNEPVRNLPTQNMPNRQIHVFDWNGNAIASLKLKEMFDCYAVSNDDKYIYTISAYKEGEIIRYDISNL